MATETKTFLEILKRHNKFCEQEATRCEILSSQIKEMIEDGDIAKQDMLLAEVDKILETTDRVCQEFDTKFQSELLQFKTILAEANTNKK